MEYELIYLEVFVVVLSVNATCQVPGEVCGHLI